MTHSHKRLFHTLLLLSAMVTALFAGAATAQTRIMPLGDSITGSPGCWRALLWNQLQDAGHTDIDFVGTLPPQGCGVAHDGDNEGHGGYLATNIAYDNLLPDWLAQTDPDVVIMHLGTNDVWSNRPTNDILDAFTTLVEQMRASNPGMTILVAQIIPMDPNEACAQCNQRVQALNSAIPGWADNLSTAASPIIVVDQYTGFDYNADTYDGVHPNASGDEKIADAWFGPLAEVLEGGNASSSSSVASSSSLSSSTSSSASSSSSAPGPLQCNWYGTHYPLCDGQTNGWGWENNESCIGYSTCDSQPAPYGVEGEAQSSSAVSSVAASSSSHSSSDQSSSETANQQCDWYGTLHPLCATEDEGWGYENSQSCIGRITCNDQYGDGGVVNL
ncbi:GDSL-type esterase/lipase family protein [Marinimicrobium agarilyticum]|uniref:GDSL-type esterase/lipase family protein n=1 Tax=Marinimicrobium agarilyticum TaxID=306546 RepID=UPI00041CD8BC|nr:GDSL-type esterase/lipase family protein [Marinimicrobium agarilyticum]